MKKYFKSFCVIFFTLFFIQSLYLQSQEKIDPKIWNKALKIHHRNIVIDTHCDTPMVMFNRGVNIGEKSDSNEVDLIRMKEGGLDAVFFAVYISNKLDKKHPSRRALEIIDEVYNQVSKYPELAELAFSSLDIRRIHKLEKRAILIGMENGGPIEGSLRLLRDFYRLGVRYITLTHNQHNDICDSSTGGEPRWEGLSPFGRKVVKEMNRLGMVIDVSHISDLAFWDVLKISKVPVIASHSCVRAICNTPRNLSDKMIKALAAKGGVIQLNFYSGFLEEEFRKKSEEKYKLMQPQLKELEEKYKDNEAELWEAFSKLWKKHAPPPASVEVLLNHIDHIVKLVGVDYVGLGSDYDGAGSFPRGLEDVSKYPLITYHLLKRGYKEKEIKKILGENFLRVFSAVENLRNK